MNRKANVTYRAYLALLLGQCQRQRAAIVIAAPAAIRRAAHVRAIRDARHETLADFLAGGA